MYDTEIALIKTYLMYSFVYDKLVGSSYFFDDPHGFRYNNYISSFEHVKDLLIGKYGDPIEDNTEWLDDTYKKNKSDWGFALINGFVKFNLAWQIGETWIEHTLVADSMYDVRHIIYYRSLELWDSVIQWQSEGL